MVPSRAKCNLFVDRTWNNNYKLQQLGISETDKCCFCTNKVEGIQHIVIDCTEYEKFRGKIDEEIMEIKKGNKIIKNLIKDKEIYLEFCDTANKIFKQKGLYRQ